MLSDAAPVESRALAFMSGGSLNRRGVCAGASQGAGPPSKRAECTLRTAKPHDKGAGVAPPSGHDHDLGSLFVAKSMDLLKKPPAAPKSPWEDEGIEFELTDLEEARRILDSESISQFGAAVVVPPEQWKKLRRAQLPTDRALTGRSLAWLIALPPTLRPNRLSLQFPRITNALAEAWHKPEQCQAAVEKLLHDERRDRKGFPLAVRNELVALRSWAQAA